MGRTYYGEGKVYARRDNRRMERHHFDSKTRIRYSALAVCWKESVEPGGENQQLITRGKSTSQNNALLQFNPDSEPK